MAWNLDSDRPIYAQILEVMQLRIIAGQYRPGERIPSVRELASEAGVNPNTMQKALSELERSGIVRSKRTSGRLITEDEAMLKQLKSELAQEHIHIFIENMDKLGFSREEILALTSEQLREVE